MMKVSDKLQKLGQTKPVAKVKDFVSKHKKLTFVLAILVVLIVAGVIVSHTMKEKATAKKTSVTDVTVETRDIENSITGTATIVAKDEYNVQALVSGDILEAPFQEGDYVEKGTLLYRVDSSDVEENIKSAKLNVEKAQVSYQDALKTKNMSSATWTATSGPTV